MEEYLKRMIEEHKELHARIAKLDNAVYNKSDMFSKCEFGNACIQLKAMRNYEEALTARLANHDIYVVCDETGNILYNYSKVLA